MKPNDRPTTNDDYPTSKEAQVLLLRTLACVAAQGWQAALDPKTVADDCPYSQFLVPLKSAWLHGFDFGRVTSPDH